ncbi:MAG: hypothetical protein E7466_01095 [Ruminococcaceae bacterium]|nr:hypothetical protein [Oscillospiraceae bacterium]MBQ3215252.1 hypothetical protein [Oscillospiraceae bacterium]
MICPNCGTDNPYGSTYCSDCGAPISALPPQAPHSPYDAGPTPPYGSYHMTPPPSYGSYSGAPTPPYGHPYSPPYGSTSTDVQPAKGLSIAALVLGIISIFLFPIITGTLAIIFAGVAKSKGNTHKMTTAGLVTGIIGVAGWILLQMIYAL